MTTDLSGKMSVFIVMTLHLCLPHLKDMGKWALCLCCVSVTPLDVVKIRIQTQTKPLTQGSFFIYNNGLMECICVCSKCSDLNGMSQVKLRESLEPIPQDCSSFTRVVQGVGRVTCSQRLGPWYQRPGHFNGTLVSLRTLLGSLQRKSEIWHILLPLLVPQDAFVKISRNEGLTALWSGLPPSLWVLECFWTDTEVTWPTD